MVGNKREVVGLKFGRLVIISRVGSVKVKCLCDCGNIVETATYSVTSGRAKSCGCLQKEIQAERLTKHGLSRTKSYSSWVAMISRCSNSSHGDYKDYGGRGVTVCERWLKFENFFEDMGTRPEGRTLDRKDNNGNYEPGNWRWASSLEQSLNRRIKGVQLSYQDESKTLAEWADHLKINRATVYNRFKRYGPSNPELVLSCNDLHHLSGNWR